MPVTQISDLKINPTYFSQEVNLESLNLDLFVKSGAVVVDPTLSAFLANSLGGWTITVRQLAPLAANNEDADVVNDDPEDLSTPSKVTAVTTVAVRQSLSKSWSQMDLAASLYGSDPLGSVLGQLSSYWTSLRQKRILASIKGLVADNKANWGEDMVLDKAKEYKAPADLTAADFISAEAIIDTAATLGDRADNLRGLAVHSTVFATMSKLNMIETVRLSDNPIPLNSFMGFPVIRDDNMTIEVVPAVAGQGGHPAYNKYYSFLFGYGAFATGVGLPKNPFAIERKEAAGRGGGQETVYSRVEWILHPQGYKCNATTTPTLAQLEAPESWTRVWERKRIPLAVLITRG